MSDLIPNKMTTKLNMLGLFVENIMGDNLNGIDTIIVYKSKDQKRLRLVTLPGDT